MKIIINNIMLSKKILEITIKILLEKIQTCQKKFLT